MDSSLQKDFYAVLGIGRDAGPKQIKQRFRELARDRHPDRFQGEDKARAELAFQEITEAFNVLADPVRRRQVDLFLARPKDFESGPGEIIRVFMNRGIRAYKQGNLIEAANNFDRVTQLDSSNSQAWHHLALTCAREPRWANKAQQAIERALELRPDHLPFLKLAGKIYAEAGMTSRAKQYYNQALKLAGSDTSIRKALSELAGGANGETKQPAENKPGLFRKIW